jgi:molybdate-binding protein
VRPGGEYNTSPPAELLPQGGEVIAFCSWDEGLVLSPGLRGVSGIGDVVTGRLRLVDREPGAEARSVLDREPTRLGIDPG